MQLGYDFKKIIVIGDTIYDVKAGKALKEKYATTGQYQVYTVAVSTGFHGMGKLKAEKPDLALPNLSQYRKILSL